MWAALAGVLLILAAVVGAVWWLRSSVTAGVKTASTAGAAQTEANRILAMDRAADAARVQRAAELDAKIATATNPAGAASVLRQITGADS